jgi:general secretion pathway protein F
MCPVFKYTGVSKDGTQTKGTIDADSIRTARDKLKVNGVYPIDLNEVKTANKIGSRNSKVKKRKIPVLQLSVLTRQLATLLHAGMPLVDSLKALSEQIENPQLRQTISEVREKVLEGTAFHLALEGAEGSFPNLYIKMVRSGEASGTLDMVLQRLADMLESQAILNRKVISAITYPVLMLLLCFGVIILLLAYVVPQISVIFKQQNKPLPMITQVIIGGSDFIRGYWWLMIIIIVGVIWMVKRYHSTKLGKYNIDKFKLRFPIFGSVFLKLATARLSTNLGTMLQSGIELLTALSISKNVVGNTYLEESIDDASLGVEQGKSLASLLSQSNRFPRIMIHMIAIGEQTGALDDMLIRVGKSMEAEIEAVVDGLTALLEPILIIFLAFIVGGILAAVMLPMLEVTSIGR